MAIRFFLRFFSARDKAPYLLYKENPCTVLDMAPQWIFEEVDTKAAVD